uniref:Myb-like domain-containing protein n=1 Tax=Brassica oleracea var. oleracea TaxID=109376 RepID=A0A0D3ASC5_BRAOL
KVIFGNVPESQLPFFASQATHDSNIGEETQGSRKERRTWSPTDDVVLISSWLNTSKDAVVGNEQRSIAFWKRIAAYYNASPKLVGCEKREAAHCKNRWQKINDLVCKFCGAFEAATRERTSGQNETDVLKLAHEIFFTNYNKKFTLEHARKELRNDQKWSELSTAKAEGSSKKRKSMDVSHSASSKAIDVDSGDESTTRPPRVKAAKARYKKPIGDAKNYEEFQTMWSLKKEDLTMKKELSKIKLLETLIAKEGPLADYEETLKKKLINELGETPTYPENYFRRRFRMNKSFFMHIVDRLSNEVDFFRQKRDGLGRLGLSALQKCTAAIRVLAYGTAADAVDEYLRLGETTTRSCVENFMEGIIYLFGDEYLRRPTPAGLQRLLDIGEYRGFPGMIESIDCMHWEWKNCPTAWKGQYSRGSGKPTIVLEAGQAPQVTFSVNGREYRMAYYLTDAVRKDVERAFGVLQARFAIVKNPALFWDKVKIGKIMRACIILHNMIVEDERDGYTQFDVSEFQQGEDNGSSHVDLTYSTDIPTNIANMMGVRTRIRDRQMHEQLKGDLVEHVWRKFGGDEDNQ